MHLSMLTPTSLPPGLTRGIGGDLNFRKTNSPTMVERPVVKSLCTMAGMHLRNYLILIACELKAVS